MGAGGHGVGRAPRGPQQGALVLTQRTGSALRLHTLDVQRVSDCKQEDQSWKSRDPGLEKGEGGGGACFLRPFHHLGRGQANPRDQSVWGHTQTTRQGPASVHPEASVGGAEQVHSTEAGAAVLAAWVRRICAALLGTRSPPGVASARPPHSCPLWMDVHLDRELPHLPSCSQGLQVTI